MLSLFPPSPSNVGNLPHRALVASNAKNMEGDRGGGAGGYVKWEKRGREAGFPRGREAGFPRGREAGFLRWQEAGEKGEHYTTLHSILHSKKCKEAAANKYRAGTGIKG